MNFNLILIVFIVGIIMLFVLSAFNKVRQIEIQKNYGARTLTDVAKLWRRAKFIPEDAKERESFYLYRDFLRLFEGEKCVRPLMLKNGGVRCMKREEFDSHAKLKTIKPTSILFTAASALVALISIIVNFMNNNLFMGLGLAVILPIVQVLLMLFVKKLIKEKDIYRDGIFTALKENCVNFVTVTKPFIVVDAYPDKFGKNSEPKYVAKGEPSAEQIAEIHDFIAMQRQLDRNFNERMANNQNMHPFHLPQKTEQSAPAPTIVGPDSAYTVAEPSMPEPMAQQETYTAPTPVPAMSEPMPAPVTNEPVMPEPVVVPEPAPVMPEPMPAPTPSAPVTDDFDRTSFISMVGGQDQSPVAEEIDAAQITDEQLPKLSPDELDGLMNEMIDNIIMSDVEKVIKNAQQGVTATTQPKPTPMPAPEPVMERPIMPEPVSVMPEPTPVPEPVVAPEPAPMMPEERPFSVDQPLMDEGEPAEDDFSLEAIGRALDAEIAKRNGKK